MEVKSAKEVICKTAPLYIKPELRTQTCVTIEKKHLGSLCFLYITADGQQTRFRLEETKTIGFNIGERLYTDGTLPKDTPTPAVESLEKTVQVEVTAGNTLYIFYEGDKELINYVKVETNTTLEP